MPLNGAGWTPTKLRKFIRSFGSAMATALVETDVGNGYLKGLGNPSGPHQLACELVGSVLADWLGAPTLDFALMNLSEEDEVILPNGQLLQAGPAFVTRAELKGLSWGGDEKTLLQLSNRQSVSQLIVLDTWTRNCDRYAPDGGRVNLDNVFLIQYPEPRDLCLVAMDFTHAFSCGGPLTRSLGFIECIRDPKVYGLFPKFNQLLDRMEIRRCATRLSEFSQGLATQILDQVPPEWEVPGDIRGAWNRFLYERAQFLAEHVEEMIWTQGRLFSEQR